MYSNSGLWYPSVGSSWFFCGWWYVAQLAIGTLPINQPSSQMDSTYRIYCTSLICPDPIIHFCYCATPCVGKSLVFSPVFLCNVLGISEHGAKPQPPLKCIPHTQNAKSAVDLEAERSLSLHYYLFMTSNSYNMAARVLANLSPPRAIN